ncbi:MAG: hypothetical protein KGO80_02265 [Bacteroidetes bacterium]|nr:hypothetical protein [Bacteroidota bacterium]
MFNSIQIAKEVVQKTMLLGVATLIVVSSFASLGLGKKKAASAGKKLLSNKVLSYNGSFSLKSGYSFRGNTVLDNPTTRVIQLNTDLVTKKGNYELTIPLRKTTLVNKVKIQLGNQTLRPR